MRAGLVRCHWRHSLITVVPGLMIWTIVCFAALPDRVKRLRSRQIQQTSTSGGSGSTVDRAGRAAPETRPARLLEQHRQLILVQGEGQAEEILTEAGRVGDAQRERMREEPRASGTPPGRHRAQIEARRSRALDLITHEIADLGADHRPPR